MAEIIGRVGWRNYVSPISPLWNNLVAYWSGDNTANDAKGTYNGTLINGATYSTGKISNGFSFDGVNDYVNISPSLGSTFSSPSSAHSYSAWIYPTSLSGYNWIIQNGLNNSGTSMILNGANLCFFIQGGNNQTTSSATLTVNTWTMVTVVYNGAGSVSFYKNGVLSNSNSASWTESVAGTNTYIGSYIGAVHFFDGKIDEVGAWNRALTATEVTELYNAGAGKQYVAPAPTYTARTTAFATATGITDTTILNALNTFDTGLISNGLATKMKALYPMVGGTATTHKYNFMDARDVNAAFRLQFSGGGVHSLTGYKPNGTNAYADTFYNPYYQGDSANSGHLSYYSRTDSNATEIEIGSRTNWLAYNFLEIRTAGFTYPVINQLTASTSFADSNSIGFYLANRTSSTVLNGWKSGVKKVSSIVGAADVSYYPIFIGALNVNGVSTTNYSTKECAFASIGSGLTDAEALTFYNLVQAMQTSLSRQV